MSEHTIPETRTVHMCSPNIGKRTWNINFCTNTTRSLQTLLKQRKCTVHDSAAINFNKSQPKDRSHTRSASQSRASDPSPQSYAAVHDGKISFHCMSKTSSVVSCRGYCRDLLAIVCNGNNIQTLLTDSLCALFLGLGNLEHRCFVSAHLVQFEQLLLAIF